MTFREMLRAAARQQNSWLCVGLDPDPALAPVELRASYDDARWIVALNRGIIDATRDLVCCYKPNLAFYEALGPSGLVALQETLALIPSDVPVIGDAKRGDIGTTSAAYARALFDVFGFHAVTVSPFLGGDGLDPFFEYADRGVFVLCKTSNPGSGEFQDLRVTGPTGVAEPLFVHVARQMMVWDSHGTGGVVAGATYAADIGSIRAVIGNAPMLIPGVGTQAGDLEAAVQAGITRVGEMAIVNASRSITYASRGSDWREAAHLAAVRLRDAINKARGA